MSLCILMIANVRLSMKALDLTQKSLTCMSSLRLPSVCILVKITIVLVLPSITLSFYSVPIWMNLVTWCDKMKIMDLWVSIKKTIPVRVYQQRTNDELINYKQLLKLHFWNDFADKPHNGSDFPSCSWCWKPRIQEEVGQDGGDKREDSRYWWEWWHTVGEELEEDSTGCCLGVWNLGCIFNATNWIRVCRFGRVWTTTCVLKLCIIWLSSPCSSDLHQNVHLQCY